MEGRELWKDKHPRHMAPTAPCPGLALPSFRKMSPSHPLYLEIIKVRLPESHQQTCLMAVIVGSPSPHLRQNSVLPYALPLLLTRVSNEPRGLGPNDLGRRRQELWRTVQRSGVKSEKEKSRRGWKNGRNDDVKLAEMYLGFRMDHKPPISQNIGWADPSQTQSCPILPRFSDYTTLIKKKRRKREVESKM